ncbi:hypothetical protein ACVWWG_008256 [Bradyrhizobium sp. LB7.2]
MGMADAARRCRQGTEQGRDDEANSEIHDVSSSAYAIQDIEVRSDQIVAEPKCNADKQIFSQSLIFSSARLTEVRAATNVGLASAAPHRTSPSSLIPRNSLVRLRP